MPQEVLSEERFEDFRMPHEPITRPMPHLRILGIRGVPAQHGGFETFAERLSLFLVQRGWRVSVYCQDGSIEQLTIDTWNGVERVRIPVKGEGAYSTIVFDWRATMHATSQDDNVCLTLGYNTAVFTALLRLRGKRSVINMDGIEWLRSKWGPLAKTWLWLNEEVAKLTAHHLIADHPMIAVHLAAPWTARKMSTIPYGADKLASIGTGPLDALGLSPNGFALMIARLEPENSALEAIRAFSAHPRGMPLIVLGKLDPAFPFHASLLGAASEEVRFLGAIYDKPVVEALRVHAAFHIHGHQVGGTNPSLVEALGAGSPILAHDNRFNRWVAGDAALYFNAVSDAQQKISLLVESGAQRERLRACAVRRHREAFNWNSVLHQYEQVLLDIAGLPLSDAAVGPLPSMSDGV